MIADAFRSMVSNAAIALSCTSGEPVDFAHKEISSMAAASPYWLCSNSVRTSAMAILEWLSGMTVVLDGGGKIVAQHMGGRRVVASEVRLK